MKNTNENTAAELAEKNIRPSFQRVRILAYMKENLCHPTVEKIYHDLHTEIPSLSKTTVYNTLNLFVEAGLVRVLNIEDNETRYDIVMKSHGHFKCESCGEIFNFRINLDDFAADELGGFRINDRNVYFKGICPACQKAKNKEVE
ncbi:Fur family transcriptional regulator [Geovibrio ferrireducens]|jgi:Fe2+ or Zn2+ uptake regulation protein|uniref:Fur family transcriptional regulator n=1 Tax=Geovibrio ferrireducens TaxID=46201 RepID=UPI002245753A|nr:Fur family transcriptional regulator [Geovibrio ferrireducens]